MTHATRIRPYEEFDADEAQPDGKPWILGALELMKAAAHEYKWNLNYGGVALLWRGGCIIRSAFLGRIKEAYDKNPKLTNLLLDPFFRERIEASQQAWRRVVATSVTNGIWAPAHATALNYFDGFRNGRLPANLLQAQRDYFGAHLYERSEHRRSSRRRHVIAPCSGSRSSCSV